MKQLISIVTCLVLLFSASAFALDEQTCIYQGESFGQSTNEINDQCLDIYRELATPQSRYQTLDELLTFTGHQNIIFIEDRRNGNDKLLRISGENSRLESIHALTFDSVNSRILALVNDKRAIYTYHFRAGGHITPIRRLGDPELRDAHQIALDLVNDQIIVIFKELGELRFYHRLADVDGKTEKSKLDVQRQLYGADTLLTSPVDAAVSKSRQELYVYDAHHKSILTFAVDAKNNTAPIRNYPLALESVGEVVKIDYRASDDRLRLTNSNGEFFWITLD